MLTPEQRRRVAEELGWDAWPAFKYPVDNTRYRDLVTKIAELIEALQLEYFRRFEEGTNKPGMKCRGWAEYLQRFNKALATGSVSELELLCYELLEVKECLKARIESQSGMLRDSFDKVNELEASLSAAQAENNVLRGITSKFAAKHGPCHYCGVEDIAKCPTGFPGCALADDLLCSEDEHMRGMLDKNKALQGELDKARIVISQAPELNMNNYNHDEVDKLNNAMIELYEILNHSPTHGHEGGKHGD